MTVFDRPKAEEIIARLDGLGLADWSKKIAEAISSTHTPVELCLALHHVLKNLKITQPLPPDLERDTDLLLKNLDKILEHHHHRPVS